MRREESRMGKMNRVERKDWDIRRVMLEEVE